jgi:hypothetical protein
MIELLGDGALRQATGIKGKDSLYPRFDAGNRVRQLVSLYDELLSDQAKARMTTSRTAW